MASMSWSRKRLSHSSSWQLCVKRVKVGFTAGADPHRSCPTTNGVLPRWSGREKKPLDGSGVTR